MPRFSDRQQWSDEDSGDADAGTVRVYVGGLPYSTTADELADAAQQFVRPATAVVLTDRMTGRSRGFGFITVADASAAALFIAAYNGKDFGGRKLTVNTAKPMEARHPRPDVRTEERAPPQWPKEAAILEPIAELVVPPGIVHVSEQVTADLIEYFTRHPDEIRLMHHRQFEELIAEVWRRFGYDVELTRQTRDGGTDVIAIKNAEVRTRFLIQCKRLAPGKKVSVEPVRELLGVKNDLGASKAVIATTVYFTREAQLLLDRHWWDLEGKDYDGVVAWLQQASGKA